jgi:hypothetical protein
MDAVVLSMLLISLVIFLFVFFWKKIVNILAEKLESQDNVNTIKSQMAQTDATELPEKTSLPPFVSHTKHRITAILDRIGNHILWLSNQPEIFFKNVQTKSFEYIENTLGQSKPIQSPGSLQKI